MHRHHQTLDIARLGVALSYGISADVEIVLDGSLSRKSQGVRYRTLDGQSYDPPYGDIHHRDGERLLGFDDMGLTARIGTGDRLGSHYLKLEAGVSLPTGSTVPDPYRLGELGLTHQHLQFGTGTVAPRVGLSWNWSGGSSVPFAWVALRLPVVRNRHGFLQGHALSLGGGVMRPLGRVGLSLALGLDREGADDWRGTPEEVTGRSQLWLAGGAAIHLGAIEVRPELRWNFLSTAAGDDELSQPWVATLAVGHTF